MFLFLISFIIVAFGQPAWNEWVSLMASLGGFALFFKAILEIEDLKKRCIISFLWYGGIQAIQLSWFLSHPYLYIIGVLLFCAVLTGTQWGILSIFVTPQAIRSIPSLLALAGGWTLLEWSRLFVLSGLPFNPVGLSLTASIYPLQFASIGGIYGLSFWVIFSNLLLLRAWLLRRWAIALFTFAIPFLYGFIHLSYHQRHFDEEKKTLKIVLVQSGLPIEENLRFQSADEVRHFVLNEWRHVLSALKKQIGKKIDLILFPEYLVPYGTFHEIYPYEEVEKLFKDVFGDLSQFFPSKFTRVSNAFIAQTLANAFNSHVVIGLEHSIYKDQHKAESFSSAFHFVPMREDLIKRYDKRILVPMGEYIPFSWCRNIAARYGISGSFTCGTQAVVFDGPVPFGASICYEELYGNLMRDNRLRGAELLVNLTNDGWYPNSMLPRQHFDHARLRSVENGIPLVRACNTGVTGAIDSLGRIVDIIDDDQLEADSLYIGLPLYHYHTLYSRFGDFPVLALSLFFILTPFILPVSFFRVSGLFAKRTTP